MLSTQKVSDGSNHVNAKHTKRSESIRDAKHTQTMRIMIVNAKAE